MSVGYSAEHDELRQVVREFLREKSPSGEVRRLMEAGDSRDDDVWALLTGQLGLAGIAVPEQYGGSGYGPVELGIVLPWSARPSPPPVTPPPWGAGCPVSPTAR
jgi:alkylation response protein AidB-like acyl-CoA dehydrogenase